MTIKDMIGKLEEIGLPLTYYEFPEGEVPPLPFMVYFAMETDNFFADGTVYEKVDRLAVEIYTEEKDFELQSIVESVLSECGAWQREGETKLDSENCYEIIYYLEV